jgi:hypothetical protein
VNRICVLKLIEKSGAHGHLEGRGGDVRFIVRRDRGRKDSWVLLSSIGVADVPEALPVERPERASQTARAAAAAREILERYSHISLDDEIADLFGPASEGRR